MSQAPRSWRVRVAFEPNRFAAEQLITVYEQLKPTKSHRAGSDVAAPPIAPQRATVMGGTR
ncbi:hypothetical protein [uncultured Thiodictyon sp.]|jgi:hypothetical protein|uniref:hypothetical protein n=1 Tax=uncultured Thiodictyon sp. TaxID=1846217 RepID=UPI0025E0F5CD|nr:hypothetical protein [uncultured Thiodictyon sp.]